jgi:hypothetical protein
MREQVRAQLHARVVAFLSFAATAAQCVALAQSTTDPRTRAAPTIMAQKLYDMANRRSAEYEVAQREFNDRQMLRQFPLEQPQSTMQQQQQVQPKRRRIDCLRANLLRVPFGMLIDIAPVTAAFAKKTVTRCARLARRAMT